ncbi:hypothetical protein L7F22_013439 [Adiantum nelumboides]|nr:hypothetical protein [Adiantum nelumboides]
MRVEATDRQTCGPRGLQDLEPLDTAKIDKDSGTINIPTRHTGQQIGNMRGILDRFRGLHDCKVYETLRDYEGYPLFRWLRKCRQDDMAAIELGAADRRVCGPSSEHLDSDASASKIKELVHKGSVGMRRKICCKGLRMETHIFLRDRLELQRRIEARAAFQDDWLQKFDWLVYKEEEAKLYSHCRTNCHVNAMEAFLLEGKEGIQNSMKRAENFKDEALFTLFRVAYHMARKNYAFFGFTDMISLLQDCRVPYSTSLYNDDKACVEMVYCIGKCLMNSTLKRVFQSPFFGVLIDESNDISKHGHLIIYLSYLIDDCIPTYSFYGIVRVSDGTARSIFNVVVDELKRNDFDLSKLIAFGSDGCSTMTGSENGVATLFKKHVNPFLTSIHCVAHRAALAVSSVAKNLEIAITLEKLVNSIATHFNHSNKRIEELRISQKDLACPILRLEHTFDVKWLSHASAIGKQYYIDPPDVDENELILDASGYTFLREYGPDKGFLFYLRGAIRGNKFFDIEIERDIFGMDLMRALEFQSLEIINSAALIDEDDFISEFRSFKQQAAISWIGLVQCSSNAICERGFSARTRIKTKLRNSMELQSLDALMKINIEGPSKLTETELEESIVLWGAKAHRHLFTSQGLIRLLGYLSQPLVLGRDRKLQLMVDCGTGTTAIGVALVILTLSSFLACVLKVGAIAIESNRKGAQLDGSRSREA